MNLATIIGFILGIALMSFASYAAAFAKVGPIGLYVFVLVPDKHIIVYMMNAYTENLIFRKSKTSHNASVVFL